MNLKELLVKTNDVVEVGEELLHSVHMFKNLSSNEPEVILCGIDGGSTQTRVMLMHGKDQDLTRLFVIPSAFGAVIDDREIKEKGDMLFQNMDTTVICQKASQETMFTKVRMVRGTKLLDANLSDNRVDSSTQKIDNTKWYENVIDGLGYAIAMEYQSAIPKEVDLYCGIALPPDSISSTKNINLFRKRMLGKYSWSHAKSGVSIMINIKGMECLTEPEAFIKAYYATEDKELPENNLHIEVGGSTTGIEILQNGESLLSASKTLPYGGTQLLEKLGNLYIEKYGGRIPNQASLKRTIESGSIKDGANYTCIIDLIDQAKKEFAQEVYQDILISVFDQQKTVTMTDIDSITVSGRTLTPTTVVFEEDAKRGKREKVSSVATHLHDCFKLKMPNAKFQHIPHNYIPLGLIFEAYSEYGGLIEEAVKEAAVTTDKRHANVKSTPTQV